MKNFWINLNITLLILVFGCISVFCLNTSIKTFASETTSQQYNFTNLIVFARFEGEDEFINDINGSATTKQLIENSYSLADYSVKDYYYRASNGNVRMQNLYLFDADNGSLTLSNNRGYYCEKADNNPDGYDSSEYELRLNHLKQDWANAITDSLNNGGKISNLDGTVNYPIDELDKNQDGKIDSITILYKYSSEFNSSWKGCLWNYQSYSNMVELVGSNNQTISSDAYVQITYDYSNYYTSTPNGIPFVNLKTFIHEMGHVFGLKDLYNSSSASPVWYMSAMAKAISHVPQYISSKEREVLGWINQSNVSTITQQGSYTINVTSSEITTDIICYKCDIPSLGKTLYLEYRKFDGTTNKYDTSNKTIYDKNDNQISTIKIKSGLVCFLIDKGTNFPNNMNCNSYNWNYQVLGGTYSTKTDSALNTDNNELAISNNLSIQIVSMDDSKLVFKIVGEDIANAHTHSLEKVDYKAPTCSNYGNILYYKCTTCNKYFLEDGSEIEYADTIITELAQHESVMVPGKSATCTEQGLTEGAKCKNCGKILIKQTIIPQNRHTESDWIIDKEASQTEQGSRHKECLVCHEHLETQTIPMQPSDNNSNPPSTPSQPNTTNDNINKKVKIAICISFGAIFIITIPIIIIRRRKSPW